MATRPRKLPASGERHLLMSVNSLSVRMSQPVSRTAVGAKWA
jgi:hypothetical protein